MIDDDLPRRLRIEADALETSPTSSQMLRNAAALIDMLHDEIIQLRCRETGLHLVCCCPNGVGHGSATGAELLFRSDRRVPRRLVLDFRVKLRAKQNYECRNPQPHHEPDTSAE